MSRAGLLLVPALLLSVAGCGDPEGDDRSSTASVGDDVCDVLTVADVERQTGAPVTRSVKATARRARCIYSDADGLPAVLVDVSSGDPSIDDLLGEARAGDAEETTTEDIDVEGTDEAVLLTDTSYGSTTVSAVARAGGLGYVVFGTGDTPEEEERISVALLTVLLGGEADGAFVPVQHPCDVLTAAEVESTVRTPVTVERDEGTADDLPGCTYLGEDVGVVLLGLGRGDVDGVVEQTVKIQGDDSEVTELDAAGFEQAFLVVDPDDRDSIGVYLGGTSASFILTVNMGNESESLEVGRGLLAKLGA